MTSLLKGRKTQTNNQNFQVCSIQGTAIFLSDSTIDIRMMVRTCSGLRPGGTQVYSSSAHPLSSSDVELRWNSPPCTILLTVFSWSQPDTSCASRGHLQFRQIFLQKQGNVSLYLFHIFPATCMCVFLIFIIENYNILQKFNKIRV